MNIQQIWFGKGVWDRLLRGFLVPASWLYALGWQTYLALYRLGIKKPAHPHYPILCVGNLTVGGSGKTPITIEIAKQLLSMGYQVVIGCSGYGGPKSESASLAPMGELVPSVWGDEPAMMRWFLPDVPLVVGRRRVLVAEIAHSNFPDAVLLLDDGFQHLPLGKDLCIVLDEVNPTNSWTLPAGPYREPRSNRNRADIVLPSAEFQVVKGDLVFLDEQMQPTPVLDECQALCAIGRPDGFLNSLRAQTKVRKFQALSDHDGLTKGNLMEGFSTDFPVAVTAKDWVKLRQRKDLVQFTWRIAIQENSIEPKEAWKNFLKEKLRNLEASKTHSAKSQSP